MCCDSIENWHMMFAPVGAKRTSGMNWFRARYFHIQPPTSHILKDMIGIEKNIEWKTPQFIILEANITYFILNIKIKLLICLFWECIWNSFAGFQDNRLSICRGHIQHGSAYSLTVTVAKLWSNFAFMNDTPNLPLRSSYEVSFVSYSKKNVRDMSRAHNRKRLIYEAITS